MCARQRAGLSFMLNQCGARAIVFDADLAARIPDANEVPSLALRVMIGAALDGAIGATGGAETLADLAAQPGADPVRRCRRHRCRKPTPR